MSDRPVRLAVVGAGIAGLTCAFRLHRSRPDAEITVFEAGGAAGGKIRTTDVADLTVDEAADAFLARVPAAVELCRELGLESELVSPAERRAFVYRHGALHRFPEGMVLGVPTDLDGLRDSGLISAAGLARAAQDLTLPRELDGAPPPGTDESVGAFVRRRVGDEVFEAFVGPLLSGVNAGDADELSLEAGAPQFAAAVRDQPSLIAGLHAQLDAARRASAGADAPVFFGLRTGTQTLTDALVAQLPAGTVRTGSPVGAVRAGADGRLRVDGLAVDAVVLATPSFATAPLVAPIDGELASSLGELEWSSVVLVTFVVPRAAVDHPLDGSGFLVSEGEGLLMSACSFGSSKWAHWDAGDDRVVFRVSAGRVHDDRAWQLDDDALVAQLEGDLAATIGLHERPLAARVSRWERALPQYHPGHLERAASWKAAAQAANPGLFLTGASYFGLGIPACITDATSTAATVVAHLEHLERAERGG